MPLTIFSSGALSIVVPRAVRINLVDRLIIPCRFPAWPVFTLPVAVTLNRFLQLDLVFILGIWFSLGKSLNETRHAIRRPRVGGIPAVITVCKYNLHYF
jgi:hypothetical protein